MVATKVWTAADLWAMPRTGERLQLIRGELIRMPGVGGQHGRIGSRFDRRLGSHVEADRLGEVYVEVGFFLEEDSDTVTFPDLAFIRADRVPRGEAEISYLRTVPDLVVEIVSPSNTPALIASKIEVYQEAGVREIWVAYPASRTIRIHRPGRESVTLGPDAVLEGGDVVPGFRVLVGDIFG